MKNYEIMFIVKSNLEESAIKSVLKNYESLVKSLKAEVVSSKDLGQKKLAYPIKKEVRGYYFLMNIKAGNETIKELDRKMRLDENLLRHLIIKEEE
jgi:small subunit ribosomal protein S6